MQNIPFSGSDSRDTDISCILSPGSDAVGSSYYKGIAYDKSRKPPVLLLIFYLQEFHLEPTNLTNLHFMLGIQGGNVIHCKNRCSLKAVCRIMRVRRQDEAGKIKGLQSVREFVLSDGHIGRDNAAGQQRCRVFHGRAATRVNLAVTSGEGFIFETLIVRMLCVKNSSNISRILVSAFT